MSRVLCAVDIDDRTRSAFGQALAIARARGARLLLVCPVPPGEPFKRRATERLDYLLQLRTLAEAAGVAVHVSVQTGEAAEIVVLHAAAREVDLIVIGSRFARRLRAAAGAVTVAEDVLRTAVCPTLVVRTPNASPSGAFHNALCAVDLATVTRRAIEQAAALVDSREPRMTWLYVLSGPANHRYAPSRGVLHDYYRQLSADALRRLEALVPDAGEGRIQARVLVGPIANEVIGTAQVIDADLIVIGARPRSRLGRRFFGVTRQLLASAGPPLLAIPVSDRRAEAERDQKAA
jgi:nucleotide-binding universal stress UspA family protein